MNKNIEYHMYRNFLDDWSQNQFFSPSLSSLHSRSLCLLEFLVFLVVPLKWSMSSIRSESQCKL